jgi:guanylate kinase
MVYDYHFLTKDEFDQKIREDDFLEYAEVFGNCYGTSRQYVRMAQDCGKHVVLVIDTQGAMNLKDQGFKAVFIFIAPPSMEELKQRLISRKTEDAMTIDERLSWADGEMRMACRYDYVIDKPRSRYCLSDFAKYRHSRRA